MHLLVQQLINGALLGAMFALMSIGLSMVFGIMKTANFAYGALYMLGGYVAYWASVLLHAPLVAVIAIAFVVMFGAGVLVEIVGFQRLRHNEDATLIFGLGLALVIRGGAVLAWGSQTRFIGDNVQPSIEIASFIIPAARLWAGIASLVLIGLVYLLVSRTAWGRAARAVSDNARRAALLGINTRSYYWVVFGLGTGISAVACVFLVPVFSLSPAVDDSALYTAFAVVILGGLGSIGGCLVAGTILGVVTTLAFGYTVSTIAPIFPLLVLILTLIFRPQGLFGKKGRLA
ncbi:branched-chain amino acid ABC transporter permease [Labrys monachus]|uniref:Branched-chain amino acid transport system permease protein n=1 Tax=Labrys monachus TaxID=217067 RepID=A0ABU0F9K6_9HYPH|nr:branched-chain amino acid ABC transporter permease [Labrys monachus]MDQ0391301.1 branched-chain amino acid transport system permease protein [Labrys monachus]